jgi:hypothetical protein
VGGTPAVLAARLRERRGSQRGTERKRRESMWRRDGGLKHQVREERFDEEARKMKLKRREDCVKRHEKVFGESQWETRRGEGWGFLGPLSSNGLEGVAMVGTRGKKLYSLSPGGQWRGGNLREGDSIDPCAPPPTF